MSGTQPHPSAAPGVGVINVRPSIARDCPYSRFHPNAHDTRKGKGKAETLPLGEGKGKDANMQEVPRPPCPTTRAALQQAVPSPIAPSQPPAPSASFTAQHPTLSAAFPEMPAMQAAAATPTSTCVAVPPTESDAAEVGKRKCQGKGKGQGNGKGNGQECKGSSNSPPGKNARPCSSLADAETRAAQSAVATLRGIRQIITESPAREEMLACFANNNFLWSADACAYPASDGRAEPSSDAGAPRG